MIPDALLGQQQGLTAGGCAVMIGCITFVCGLMAFCFYRILHEAQPSERHHAPLDIDTHDRET
ncbi:MAG: hypothetical protein JSU86_00710 [Phycisphaerales bacterium]|nr:MAG: hypothetical protein JSU86_00710 [Phycisphaerales bacterium]